MVSVAMLPCNMQQDNQLMFRLESRVQSILRRQQIKQNAS